MRFSVVMPSYLGHYNGAATGREDKIYRAVDSVLNQTFTDWELIIVADGCEKTYNMICTTYKEFDKINCLLIKKQLNFSGVPRSLAIDRAIGDYIVYLDIDDFYGYYHLQIISDQLQDYDWVWFNDYRWRHNKWVENPCSIVTIGRNGTSNICHKRSLDERWNAVGYAHDFHFNKQLLKYKNHDKILTPEYFVCHVPGMYDI
jgi:glycosyltransferase involved in cell wall biosynthesis